MRCILGGWKGGITIVVSLTANIPKYTTRFFFYKKHFYKQNEAEISLFWNTNIEKYRDLDNVTIPKSLYSFQHKIFRKFDFC